MRTHSAQTIPQAETKRSLQVSKERVSVIPFRFPVHLICHFFFFFYVSRIDNWDSCLEG